MKTPRDLPPEIAAKLMACLDEVDGEYRVRDKKALVALIVTHGAAFPFLRELVKVNEDALIQHYEKTGEVPPGVKLVRTTTEEGSNVVDLDVVLGPRSTK